MHIICEGSALSVLSFLGAVKSISETGLYTTFRRFGGSQPHGSEVQATFLANLVWVQKAMLNVRYNNNEHVLHPWENHNLEVNSQLATSDS